MKETRQSEAAFQRTFLEAAKRQGWLCAHFRTARTQSGGWATPVQADGAGFPDVILVRGWRVLAVELKSDRGRLSDAQKRWLAAFKDTEVETYVFRPRDWPVIERVLSREAKAA